jgi:RNA polymerase sigma-70 factor (ECF subfamily)
MQYAERAYYAEQAEHQFLLALRERIERIVRWYVRTGDDDVADLTQECLLRVYNKLDSIRDLDKMEPWLKAVVRNTVFTWLRERKREQEVCSVGLDPENETDTYCLPEDDLLLYFVLQEAMQTLSEADQQMLELRYGAGMSYREIAREIGLNEETVRKRISRAVARLRAHPIIKSIITEGG